jgi:hypothetical protein
MEDLTLGDLIEFFRAQGVQVHVLTSEADLGGPPWRCPGCRRLNTADRKWCKNCHRLRPPQEPQTGKASV